MTASHKLLLLVAGVVIGCTPSTAANSGGNPPHDSRTLTLEEINRSQIGGNAYEVISRLRPSFLTGRGEVSVMGPAESKYPSVYLDGVLYGDIKSLRNLDASQIGEVRLYPAWEAQTKFGTGNNSGVIAITSRR
jgi:hypothetical protein